MPFILLADASVEKIGAGIDNAASASRTAATADTNHFMLFLPNKFLNFIKLDPIRANLQAAIVRPGRVSVAANVSWRMVRHDRR